MGGSWCRRGAAAAPPPSPLRFQYKNYPWVVSPYLASTSRGVPMPGGTSLSLTSTSRANSANGHGHVIFRGHDDGDPMLGEPPQINSIPKPPIKDHVAQPVMASLIHPGLGDQCLHRRPFRLVDRHHLHGQGDLCASIDQDHRFPAVDGVKWLYSSGHTETREIANLERCVR